jgi:hypothetical protein
MDYDFDCALFYVLCPCVVCVWLADDGTAIGYNNERTESSNYTLLVIHHINSNPNSPRSF